MFEKLKKLDVIDGIIKYLEDFSDKSKDGILHLDFGKGEFAKELFDAGITKYHGTTDKPIDLKAAKKLVPGFSTRFHKMTNPLSADVLKYKHDIIISLGSIDYSAIPSGQRLIVVTEGTSYEKICLILTPLFAQGATTTQHGNYFVTYGKRK